VEGFLPATVLREGIMEEWIFQILAAVFSLTGIFIAYRLYYVRKVESYSPSPVQSFFLNGWNFDKLYDNLFVKPFVAVAAMNRTDIIDRALDSLGATFGYAAKLVSFTQNGKIKWYLTGIGLGIILILSILLLK
jgi:NADH-quinone oxidoreductase subunit L